MSGDPLAGPWRPDPLVLQVNAWTWLDGLSRRAAHTITFANVDRAALDLADGFDAVWLMGVWARSPSARDIARRLPDLDAAYRAALPDVGPLDVVGSPFSVFDYQVDPRLGGDAGLARVRALLAARGVRLILDFVPNHLAVDHPWTDESPECFVQGTPADLAARPDAYYARHGRVFAHGRDPYFPPWIDTVQVDAFSVEARHRLRRALLSIARRADGVRCDMAMLLLNAVFAATWGRQPEAVPSTELWQELVPAVKGDHPHFLLIAEVYWNLESSLTGLGFDLCYDKGLYDRLHGSAADVREALRLDWHEQRRRVRFVENHDEPRALAAFGRDRVRAAALLVLTLPGARLVQEGQREGHRIRLPVQLGRRPEEPDDDDLRAFYSRVWTVMPGDALRQGSWTLCDVNPLDASDHTADHLVAHQWQRGDDRLLVVVNFDALVSRGAVVVAGLAPGTYELVDGLSNVRVRFDRATLDAPGLPVILEPWSGHAFSIRRL